MAAPAAPLHPGVLAAGPSFSPQCPLLPPDARAMEQGDDGLEMVDLDAPGDARPTSPPPLPPRPSSVDNQCDQQCGVEHDMLALGHAGRAGREVRVELPANPFSVKHQQAADQESETTGTGIMGPVERELYAQANQRPLSGAGLAAPGAVSTFLEIPESPYASPSASPAPSSGHYAEHSGSWELSGRPASACRLNEGFELSSEDDESSTTTMTPESNGALQPNEVPRPRRSRRPRSTASDVSSSTLTRCRQWAHQARRSLRVGGPSSRPVSHCFSNPLSEAAAGTAAVGPLPVDSSSFFHSSEARRGSLSAEDTSAAGSTVATAYDRSSMVEPQRQWSLDWTAGLKGRPHSVAVHCASRGSDANDAW